MQNINRTEEIKKLSDDELLNEAFISHDSPIIKYEIERRSRVHQHELNLKMLKEQNKWTLLFALIGIFGVIVGVYLTNAINYLK